MKKTFILRTQLLMLVLLGCLGLHAQTEILQSNATLNACTDFQDGDIYTDSGGSAGNYQNNELSTIQFCAPAGETVSINFTTFNVEASSISSCFDNLTVSGDTGGGDATYAGDTFDAGAALACTDATDAAGNPTLGPFTSAVGGCLSFTFDSDGSITPSGWTATISISNCVAGPITNDICADAEPITCGSVTAGSTVQATADGTPFCGTSNTAPGVWYSFVGNGDFVSLTTCSPNTNYDTKLHVYTGGCAGLTCVAGNDDDFSCPNSIFHSSVSFCTTPGTTYLILVSGFSTGTGDFNLTLTCTPAPLTITCPPDQTLDCTQAIPAAATTQAEFLAAGGTINTICPGAATVTSSDVTTSDNCGIQVVRTYTVTQNGQTATCVQNLQTLDTTAPVITCPPGQTLTCFESVPNPITTAAGFVAAGGTISDDCTANLADFSVFSTETNNGGTNCPGDAQIVTRTYYVSDLCGNLSSCTQTFTYLASTQGPVITSVLPTCYKYCGNLVNPSDSDITYTTDCAFDGTVTITGPVIIGPENCPGTIYRFTYSVTDDCGRTSAPVTRDFIIGNDGPTIECPATNLILECGDPNNDLYIQQHLALPTANTACELGYTITNNYIPIFGTPCVGTRVVTFTVTDACNRTATCTTTITILDTTAPVITSTYIPGQCDEIECSGDINGWFNIWRNKVQQSLSATDNCQNPVWSTVPSNPQPNQDCNNGEAVTWVTWVARDNCGNESEVSYYFKILDTHAPEFTFVPADGTIACDDDPVFGTPTATDECGNVTITFEDTANNTLSGSLSGDQEVPPSGSAGTGSVTGTLDVLNGTLVMNVSFSGLSGNTTASHLHNAPAGSNGGVFLNLGPLGFPTGVTSGSYTATATLTAAQVATTLAGNAYMNIHTEAVPSGELRAQIKVNTCEGTYTRTWTAEDECDLTSVASQTLSYEDTDGPVITGGSDTTVECDGNGNTAELDAWLDDNAGASAADDCNNATWSNNYDPANWVDDANCTGGVRAYVDVTFTATDDCGNATDATFRFNVTDTTPPNAPAAPADVNVQCASDVPAPVDLTASDACDGDITVSPSAVITPGNCDNQFTMVRTWTFVDNCGNSSSVSQTIQVNDTTPPDAPAPPADVNVQCAADVPPPVNLTANDNCDGDITVSPSAVITPGNCDNQFTMVRTWTFTDGCGNQSSVSQTINVNDTTPPDAPAPPADVNVQCADDVPPPVDLTANDNCDGDITVSPSAVITPGNCDDQFVMVRTWTFTDGCGNQSSVSQTIFVDDTTPPTFTFVPADYESGCIQDNTVTTYARICASSDDAEEDDDNGEVDLTSSDLELIEDPSQDKDVKVGLRFKDLHIPAGATITNAWIQFTAAASIDIDPSELEIFGQDSDNASTFTDEDENITDRPKTSASTDWEPADWEVVGDNHEAQRTPDLSDIVQEIVNRGGYTSESALAFIICGEGKRTAYSFDGSPGQAPELYVTYEVDPWGTPAAEDNCDGAVTITHVDTEDNNDGCAGSITRTWTATDECGNTSTAAQTINFFDNVPPVFTYVPPHMNVSCDDFDFPPSFDTPIAEDNCDDVTITFEDYFVTGDEDSCDEDDEDSDYRRTWTATDGCGNTTTATKRYNVKESYALFGTVLTEENEAVEDVVVSLEGFNGMTTSSQTLSNGIYSFFELPVAENYTVTPNLDQNPLNGVSSFDLVLMAKHVLQSELLDSPYKIIAADVNNSGAVTTMDIVELRKLILHIDDSFTNNTSWRFVESAFVFPQPNNPFATIFPEEVFINGLTEGEIHDFVGVKVGDVNNSAVANAMADADDRTMVSDLVFDVREQQLEAGKTYDVTFQADNFNSIHGYQFTLNFDQTAIEFNGLNAGELDNLSENNFGLSLLDQGVITTSWTNQEAHSVARGTNLFQLSFTAKANVILSEVLSIGSRYTQAEAYNSNLDLMDVQLRFGEGDVVTDKFRLYQNTPNPFHQETVIGFELPADMSATITILDVAGRQLKQVTADYTKGYNQLSLDQSELSGTGIYYYQLVTEDFEQTRKMIFTH